MKNKIFLIALLFIAISFSNKLYSIELDTVWVSDEYGQILFQHPVSKNILIAKNGITEIDSKTGKFVRSFPIEINGIDMSPDGSKFAYYFWEDTRYVIEVYDYSKEKVIHKTNGLRVKFLNNNEFIYTRPSDGKHVLINKYDMSNSTITEYDIPINGSEAYATTLATSPDGKYIAYATYEKNNTLDSKAHLYLMDAETMKVLKKLGSWDSRGQEIKDITFSPNSKMCRILSYSSSIPISILDIEKNILINKYTQDEVSNHLFSIDFIDNEHILLRGGLDEKDATTQIQKIDNKQILFNSPIFIDKFHYNISEYYLYCSYIYNKLYYVNKNYCLNLNNIISGIPPTNPITVSYKNKTIIINPNNKLINSITINTIEGREVFRQNFDRTSQQNQIEIPLELINGLYFIKITSGIDNFVHKLLIKE